MFFDHKRASGQAVPSRGTSRMMPKSAQLAVLIFGGLWLLQSCESPQPAATQVNVRLIGTSPDTDAVTFTFGIDGRPDSRSPYTFQKNTTFVGIVFKEPGVTGQAQISVETLSKECLIGSGQGQIQVTEGKTFELEIAVNTLTKSCPLTVRTNGQGAVKSDPMGIDCGPSASCVYRFPFGQKVKLNALPGIPGTPYLWGGRCSGGRDCEVLIDGATRATVDFTPRVCTPAGFCWEHPRPQGADLYTVWVAPDQTVYAAGRDGAIVRGSGVTWASLESGTRSNINALWGFSNSDIWAATNDSVLHWDGTKWSTEMALAASDTTGFYGIWGSSPSDIWLVGATGVIQHFDGTSWKKDPYVFTGRILWGVWGSGPSDVWIVGAPGIALHNTGAGWVAVDAKTTAELRQVWGTGPGDVWAVGDAIRRWNGTQWVVAETGLTTPLLDQVWGTGPNAVWGVTSNRIHRWNGVQWTVASTLSGVSYFSGIGGAGSTAWAIGKYGALAKLENTDWSLVSAPTAPTFQAVWMSALDDGWAVGDRGALYHWDGLTWDVRSGPVSADLKALWGTARDDVWAVGTGAILRFNGTDWASPTGPSGLDLRTITFQDVYGASANDVWIVGEKFPNSYALHWNGAALEQAITPPATASVFALAAAVYVGGNSGTSTGLFKLNGAATGWDKVATMRVRRVRGVGSELYVAAADGLFRFDGTAWSQDVLGEPFSSVYPRGPGDVWAYGGSDENIRNITLRLLRWNGSAWTVAERFPIVVNSIAGFGSKDVWVAGEAGSVLHLTQ